MLGADQRQSRARWQNAVTMIACRSAWRRSARPVTNGSTVKRVTAGTAVIMPIQDASMPTAFSQTVKERQMGAEHAEQSCRRKQRQPVANRFDAAIESDGDFVIRLGINSIAIRAISCCIVIATRGDLRDRVSAWPTKHSPFRRSQPARALPSEEDYAAISEAFMETSRGRWFLTEYAKRNRNADTRLVLGRGGPARGEPRRAAAGPPTAEVEDKQLETGAGCDPRRGRGGAGVRN